MSLAQKRAEARTRYYTRSEADRIGWNVRHPTGGGGFLEEQEIVDFFPALASVLGKRKPDFAALRNGHIQTVIECKSSWSNIDVAVAEAQDYADTISKVKGHDVRLAVGVAGTPDRRVHVKCYFRADGGWTELTSHGYPLTQLPTPDEVDLAGR